MDGESQAELAKSRAVDAYRRYVAVMQGRRQAVQRSLPESPAKRVLLAHYQPLHFERFEAQLESMMHSAERWTEFWKLLESSEAAA